MTVGGPRPAVRSNDGRTDRRHRRLRVLTGLVLDRLIDSGTFHPKLDAVAWAVGSSRAVVHRYFGARRAGFAHVARVAAGRVVDAIGLSAEARHALTPKDEKAIAMAVLAGRRLEPGE
jgi:hypothetical protein